MTVPRVNYAAKRDMAVDMITRWGAPAVLRNLKTNVDRPCIAFVTNYSPQERAGTMIDPTYRKALVSPLAPDGSVLDAPSRESDTLVTFIPDTDPPQEYEKLKIMAPPDKISPTGIVLYWKLSVRR